jgi:PhnB protein
MAAPVPSGYHNATAVLCVSHLNDATEFYRQAFGAKEHRRLWSPSGKVAGQEVSIGDSRIMLMSESPERGLQSPKSLGACSGIVHLFLADAEDVFARATSAGASVVEPLTRQYWGDLTGMLEDPYGHRWIIAQRLEDLSEEEILTRGPTSPM